MHNMARRRRKLLCSSLLAAGAIAIAQGAASQPASAQDFFTWLTNGPTRSESSRSADSSGQETRRAARSQARHARKERPRQEAETPLVDTSMTGAAAKLRESIAPEGGSAQGQTIAKRAKDAQPATVKQAERRELPLFLVVSIADQHVSIYNHDGLVTRSAVSTGMPGHATPRGVFTILGRERLHHSNIYSGAPMPFMQRITWSGIAMHTGVVPGHPASHGCVRLPAAFAPRLWGMTRIGERVIIAQQDVYPFEFAHAFLPAPKMRSPEPEKASPEAQTASIEAPPAPTLNPRQYAERLRTKASADAGAAAKKLKALAVSAEARRQEAAKVLAELKASEAARATAQINADVAARAYEEASAAVGAKQLQTVVATADIKDSDAAETGEALAGESAATLDAAKERKLVAAEARVDALDALLKAEARLDAARKLAEAKTTELADIARLQGETAAAADQATAAEKAARRLLAPVSLLISRKDQRIYIRQDLIPVFDAPIVVKDPQSPLGDHLLIASAATDDGAGLKWTAFSIPGAARSDIAAVLDRIEIAPEIRERIAERLWVGGSIIVSDNSPSSETGADGTDLTIRLR
jgi:lipoprotein-anchoring transpeptidase ErfK/SrfK